VNEKNRTHPLRSCATTALPIEIRLENSREVAPSQEMRDLASLSTHQDVRFGGTQTEVDVTEKLLIPDVTCMHLDWARSASTGGRLAGSLPPSEPRVSGQCGPGVCLCIRQDADDSGGPATGRPVRNHDCGAIPGGLTLPWEVCRGATNGSGVTLCCPYQRGIQPGPQVPTLGTSGHPVPRQYRSEGSMRLVARERRPRSGCQPLGRDAPRNT
jgi:hypothetical protein